MGFDVIVVGAGHAGVEAAHAAARLGVDTLLITHSIATIGEMSCNPSIGGIGRAVMIREIDALGGLIGICADDATIHSRMLNRSKGPAVWGLRAQIDREIYKKSMQKRMLDAKGITILEGSVGDLMLENDAVVGIIDEDGKKISAKAVVIATGTFLGAAIYVGNKVTPAGRRGCKPSNKLAESLKKFDLKIDQMRTGTPPRIKRDTINWSVCDPQPTESDPERFSFMSGANTNQSICCYITHTTPETHAVVKENSSQIYDVVHNLTQVIGPRYCLSLDDKVAKFADKQSHHIFLEIESLNSDLVYPNGLSASFSEDLQQKMVNTVPGLENAKIVIPGYSVVYNFIDPKELRHTLEVKKIKNLFLAGQINGTTGYTEAAGQGLIAGINAGLSALKSDKEFVLMRDNAFLGVMVDDLVTNGVIEPYRMFTSRAAHRLFLRQDNADRRMTKIGESYGLVERNRVEKLERKLAKINICEELLKKTHVMCTTLRSLGIKASENTNKHDLYKVLAFNDCNMEKIKSLCVELNNFDREILRAVEIDAKYEPYITKQIYDIGIFADEEQLMIPKDFDYSLVRALSNESIFVFSKWRPATVGAASKIPGVTPACIMVLINYIKKMFHVKL